MVSDQNMRFVTYLLSSIDHLKTLLFACWSVPNNLLLFGFVPLNSYQGLPWFLWDLLDLTFGCVNGLWKWNLLKHSFWANSHHLRSDHVSSVLHADGGRMCYQSSWLSDILVFTSTWFSGRLLWLSNQAILPDWHPTFSSGTLGHCKYIVKMHF